jgi:hypothetical protein
MIKLTVHTEEAMTKRGIQRAWIEATLTSPDWSERDPRHPERTRSYRAVPETGGRTLRVVHRPDGTDVVVITVHPDRGAPKRRKGR